MAVVFNINVDKIYRIFNYKNRKSAIKILAKLHYYIQTSKIKPQMSSKSELFESDKTWEEPQDSSEEENPNPDPNLLKKLHRSLNLPKSKPKVYSASQKPSQFNVNFKNKISISDLTKTISDDTLKRKIAAVETDFVGQKLDPPPEQSLDKKLDRITAYKSASKNVSRWNQMVKKNRQAEQLCFYEKQSPAFIKPSLGEMNAKFEAEDGFEKEFENFVKSLNRMHDDGLEEREERERIHAEKARAKSRTFLRGIESKRKRKIKSKQYRKRIKVATERAERKLKSEGIEMEADKEKRLFDRAKERMDLRHKNSGKWAKSLGRRPFLANSEQTKVEMAEKDNISKELMRKIEGEDAKSILNGNDESEENMFDVKSDDENDGEAKTGLFAMKFMKEAIKRKEDEVDGLFDESNELEPKDEEENTQNILQKENELEGKESVKDCKILETKTAEGITTELIPKEANLNSESDNKKKAVTFNLPSKDEVITYEKDEKLEKLEKKETKREKRRRNKLESLKFEDKEFDTDSEAIPLSDDSESESIVPTGEDKAEFEKEQKEMIREEFEESEDDYLSGWGSWAGAGTGRKEIWRKKLREDKRKKALAKLYQKNIKKDVIINNKKIRENLEEVTIESKPIGFKSEKTYNKMVGEAVGIQWNNKNSFQEKIKPKILLRKGIPIEPLKMGDSLHKMKRR